MEPNGGSNLDAVAASQLSANNLTRARYETCTREHQDVPPGTGAFCRAQKIEARTGPHDMLYEFQQLCQRGRSDACSDTCEDYGQPEAGRARTFKGGGYHFTATEPSLTSAKSAGKPFRRRFASHNRWDV